MVSEAREQSMAWMETDYSKHTHFRWKIKWWLEHLDALGIMGEVAPLNCQLNYQQLSCLSRDTELHGCGDARFSSEFFGIGVQTQTCDLDESLDATKKRISPETSQTTATLMSYGECCPIMIPINLKL